ncbi:MAG TPA: nuclear transport factor 2 family protein [Bryobacteraceae bacterium]|jgi:ketosteroid isomerase-like protein|nr:nuclear transport factor 2 family protein [Bryobacteraceae bacterium]
MKTLALTLLLLTPCFAQDDSQLLATRVKVWEAWFAGDVGTLKQLIPANAIAISAGDRDWKFQQQILDESADFHAHGGKLTHLEFARTQVQHFGNAAFIYSDYRLETEQAGKRSQSAGRVTEVFVFQNGRWINPGWHTDHQETP